MQTATLPPEVASLVSGRTRAVLTGVAIMLPFPTTPRPPNSIQITSKSFYIHRYIPDNVQGWMNGGPVQGWAGYGKRRDLTPHRAQLLLALCERRICESVLPTVRRIARQAAA